MRSRVLRLAGVVAGLLSMLVSTAPPAPATSVRTATVVATMVLAAPLGYPCTGNKTTPGTRKCPPTVPTVHADLPLPDDPLAPANFHNHYGGNTIGIVAVDDLVCADSAENINKAGKAPGHLGTCTFTLLASPKNHINGYCDMNGGQMVWRFVDALGQSWTLDLHFTGTPPGTLHVTGHAVKQSSGRVGKVKGELAMTATPTAGTPPGNSCANKTATVFTLDGELEWEVVTFI